MPDEKDRLGKKLSEREKAEEDRYFAKRDQEALERLRRQQAAAGNQATADATRMRCPKDGAALATQEREGVSVDGCPACHGVWLDAGELETLAQRERDSWLGRLFFRPRL